MQWQSFFIPVVLGAMAVFQAGINRRIIPVFGLGGAVLLNTIILLTAAILLLASSKLSAKFSLNEFQWWFVFPGICGLALLCGLPISIARWGAVNTFLWLIASQILFSAVWDYWIEGLAFSWNKLLGACLAVAGSWIASR